MKPNTKPRLQDLAKSFAARTTSHGVARIAASKTRFRRYMWTVIVLGSFIGYSVHVGTLVTKFLQYDVAIKMDVITGDSVLFPAVTVCNSNKLRLSEIRNSSYSDLAAVNEPYFSFTYLGPCMPGDRACDDDNKVCIKRYMWCNGIVDCANGVDETDCNSGRCLPDQYKCRNGKCLPSELKCNFRDDCGDNSDELGDADCIIRRCVYGEYMCQETLQCLPLHVLCDDHIDCADGSDEMGLGDGFCRAYKGGLCSYNAEFNGFACSGSPTSYMTCPSGYDHTLCGGGSEQDDCLVTSNMCDGITDCQLGIDESFCNTYYFKCPYGKFKCDSGQCVPEDKLCDGRMDCKDGKDEMSCHGDQVQELNWYCNNLDHNDTAMMIRCNGYPNCENGTDEEDCESYQCPPGMLKCSISHICVEFSKLCDGSYDCAYGLLSDLTDEENCTNVECSPGKYQCDSGQCIDSSKRCDLHFNCLDKSDEYNCTQDDCLPGEFLCSKLGRTFCFDGYHVCDGIMDCTDGTDESNCSNYSCPDTTFPCGLFCKPVEKRCDIEANCPGLADEVDCENNVCPEGFFRCRNGQCIRQHLYCDEPMVPDCADGSDELFCNGAVTCEDHQLQCSSGWCVDSSLACDGINDCGDGTDEYNCTLCNENEYTCNSRFEDGNRIVAKCIPANRVCDRFDDCHFGDDENDCEYVVHDATAGTGWNAKYLSITDDPNIYEEFRENIFVNRPTDFIPNEYPPLWGHFLVSSNTPDFSDLKNVLRLTPEEVRRMGHQAEDLILQCTYDQRECNIEDFYQFQDDVHGNCYTFNHGRNGSTIRKATNTGSDFGLKLTLFAEENEYLSIYGQKTGARLVIHDPYTTPFPGDEGIDAKTGTATSVIIKGRGESRLPYPHGNCTYQTRVDSEEYFYSIMACQKDCLNREMFNLCGCVNSFYNNKPRCDILDKTQDACVQLMYFFYQRGKLNCNCRQPCSVMQYMKMMSLTSWPSTSYSPRLMSSLLAVNPKMRSLMNSDEKISKNLARVEIYYETLNLELMSEVEDYPPNQLWADVGGALGLWIGLSIITVIEFAEFVFEVMTRGNAEREQERNDSPNEEREQAT